MRKIELRTCTDKFVKSHEIPAFNELPAVVFWGDRTFSLLKIENEIGVYREVFAYCLVDDVLVA